MTIKLYNHKQILHYCFFIILIFYWYNLTGGQNIQETLQAIPKIEREALEKLFRSLFNGEHFSYTLFGDKPMSLTNYSTSLFNDDDDFLSLSELRFRKRWETWKKYEPIFPMPYYLLIEIPSDKDEKNDIYFINKQYFTEKVDEHISCFKRIS